MTLTDVNQNKYHLEEEGGDSYTARYLGKNWSIYNYAYSSLQPIPELQDRVLSLSDTQQALVENQYQFALQVDNAFREISKLEKAILSAAYQEGERTVKCYKKKTQAGPQYPRKNPRRCSGNILLIWELLLTQQWK